MKRRCLARSTSGAAAVEFALILLPFCMLLMGMIDYGWYFFVDLACTNAVREGARAATTSTGVCASNAGWQTAGDAAVKNALSALPAAIASTAVAGAKGTCTTIPNGASPYPEFQYTITFPFNQLTGFKAVPVPGAVTTSAIMRGQ